MTGQRGSRLAALWLAAAGGVGLWQALRLERWGFDGPDAGFFPQLVAALCVLLAVVVAIRPGRGGATDDDEANSADGEGVQERRTFGLYLIALVVMAVGSMTVGFVLTATLLTIIIMRLAEGRSWFASIGFGLACALVCLVLFGWLLRVDLPQGPLERAFYSMVR